MLQCIDGEKTIATLARQMEMNLEFAIASFLALYRKQLFHWRHMKPTLHVAQARSHFNIDV